MTQPTVEPNVARLRWLLTEAAKHVGLTLSTNMINRVCAEQHNMMVANHMILMWETTIDDQAAQMEPQL